MSSVELRELCQQGFEDTLKYLSSKFPDMLTFDVDIVSVPYCCGGAFQKDSNEKLSLSCWCGNREEEGFTELEQDIAKRKVIKSLIIPKDFHSMLIDIEKVVGEKD